MIQMGTRPRIKKRLIAGSSDEKKSILALIQSRTENEIRNYGFQHLADKDEFKWKELP